MKRRVWTEEEDLYLTEWWGIKPLSYFAKKFKRTEIAVIKRTKKLKLGGAYGKYSLVACQVSKILKVDLKTLKLWNVKYNFPMEKKTLRKRYRYLINLEDLMKWLENNKEIWDASRVEVYALTYEPQWLQEKRKYDYHHRSKLKKWTKEEDKKVLKMYMDGLNPREIAEIHDCRTVCGIARRLSRLDFEGNYIGG